MNVKELKTGQLVFYKNGNSFNYGLVIGVQQLKRENLINQFLNKDSSTISVVIYYFATMKVTKDALEEETLVRYLRTCVKNLLKKPFITFNMQRVSIDILVKVNTKPYTKAVESNIMKSKLVDDLVSTYLVKVDTIEDFVKMYTNLETNLFDYLKKLQKGFPENFYQGKIVHDEDLKFGEIYVNTHRVNSQIYVIIFLGKNQFMHFVLTSRNSLTLFILTSNASFIKAMLCTFSGKDMDALRTHLMDTGYNIFDLNYNRERLQEIGII